MDKWDIAIRIYNRLNSCGAELGNASIGIIKDELDLIDIYEGAKNTEQANKPDLGK